MENEEVDTIVVDMDETLVRSDTLIEQLLALARSNPFLFIRYICSLPLQKISQFKSGLSEIIAIDPEILPYNENLIDFLKEQKYEKGKRIVLATASHESVAYAVADHLGFFDQVLATTGSNNLKGVQKAGKLVENFGDKGFIYAGDSKADTHIWTHASGAILVGKVDALREHINIPVIKEFPNRNKFFPMLVRQIRLYQWVKNILVFVPIIAAGEISETTRLVTALLSFFAFSFTASGGYVVNDLLDLEADRKHPRKKARPFASGDLRLQAGLILAATLFVLGLGIAFLVNLYLVLVLLGYLVLSVAYSLKLKLLPLVDVFTLAALYSMRILSGGIATDTVLSHWLLSFSGNLFLSLAFLKRYVETNSMEKTRALLTRRGYKEGESQFQMVMGIAAGFSSVIVFSIWLDSEAFQKTYSNQLLLWMILPFLLFWLCRLWLSAYRGQMHDDPIVYTVRDKVSWLVFSCCTILYLSGLTV